MKTKFKLTPKAHKEIIKISRTLPKLVKLNPDGSHQMRVVTEFKGQFDHDVKGKLSNGRFNHFSKGLEPVCVNHELELIKLFSQHGSSVFQKYIDYVNEIYSKTEKLQ